MQAPHGRPRGAGRGVVAKFEETARACAHCQLLLRLRAGFALGLGVHASTQALTMLVV